MQPLRMHIVKAVTRKHILLALAAVSAGSNISPPRARCLSSPRLCSSQEAIQ